MEYLLETSFLVTDKKMSRMAILENTLELVWQVLTNSFLRVDHDVNLKSKKISLCCKP